MTASDLNVGVITKGEDTIAPKITAINVNKASDFLHLYKSKIMFPELERFALLIVSFIYLGQIYKIDRSIKAMSITIYRLILFVFYNMN
jgi:hypothetical protein